MITLAERLDRTLIIRARPEVVTSRPNARAYHAA